MSAIRSFIALDLPEELHQQLAGTLDCLQEMLAGMPLRWTPVGNIHLTLKFLGDVSENNIPRIKEILQAEAVNAKPLEIGVGGFGVFPSMTRPRVLWVGVEAPEEMMHLQRRIEGEAARLGYAPDKREFSPHLTMGRVSRNANPKEIRAISEALRKYKLGFLGAARIHEVHLYRSDLKPTGAVYSKMFTASLGS